MGRIVTAAFRGITLTSDATQDIWELTAAADIPLRLLEFRITSSVTTAAALDLALVRRTTAGTGGTAVTETLLGVGTGTITGALVTDVETPGILGDVLDAEQWEQLGPYERIYQPEVRIDIPQGGRIALSLETAATPVVSGRVVWEEIGG